MALFIIKFTFLAVAMLVSSLSVGMDGAVPEPSKYILSFNRNPNPLNITVDPSPEKNYFILLGDWGCTESDSTGVKLQTGVANLMQSFVASQKEKGNHLLFVGTVGDNFYSSGQTCKYWEERWTDMYGHVATDYPWLAVFGNHDWGGHDIHALCAWGTTPKYTDPHTKIPYAANQLNAEKGGCNPANYYLPDFGYYYSIPALNFEWIAVEESQGNCKSAGNSNWNGQTFADCNHSQAVGCDYLGRIKKASENLLTERANVSANSNFMVINHYVNNGPRLMQLFTDARGGHGGHGGDADIVWSAFGHQHEQNCEHYASAAADAPCDQILTGGGGRGSPNDLKGFFVIGFDENKQMVQPLKIDDAQISCLNPCGMDITEEDNLRTNFFNCCFDPESDDAKLCHFYDLQKC